MFRLQSVILPFCAFLAMVFASAIVSRDITIVVNSLNAEGSAMGALTTQTGAFTSSDCSVLGGLLAQTVQVGGKIQQAATDIAAHSGSFSAQGCDQIKAAISNFLSAHAAGLSLTAAKKPDFLACGLGTAGIRSQMNDLRAKTASIFTNLSPKVSGTCASDIAASGNQLLGYWDSAITNY